LLLGQGHRAFGMLIPEQPLRRRTLLGEYIRVPETPMQPRDDEFRRQ
jgi:hypothetical protein